MAATKSTVRNTKSTATEPVARRAQSKARSAKLSAKPSAAALKGAEHRKALAAKVTPAVQYLRGFIFG